MRALQAARPIMKKNYSLRPRKARVICRHPSRGTARFDGISDTRFNPRSEQAGPHAPICNRASAI
jgi:hypothetical protein